MKKGWKIQRKLRWFVALLFLPALDSFFAFWLLPISLTNAGYNLTVGCASATFSLTTILSAVLIFDLTEDFNGSNAETKL